MRTMTWHAAVWYSKQGGGNDSVSWWKSYAAVDTFEGWGCGRLVEILHDVYPRDSLASDDRARNMHKDLLDKGGPAIHLRGGPAIHKQEHTGGICALRMRTRRVAPASARWRTPNRLLKYSVRSTCSDSKRGSDLTDSIYLPSSYQILWSALVGNGNACSSGG